MTVAADFLRDYSRWLQHKWLMLCFYLKSPDWHIWFETLCSGDATFPINLLRIKWQVSLCMFIILTSSRTLNFFSMATVNWCLGKQPVEQNFDIHSAACLDSKWRSVLNLEITALTSAFAKTTCLAGIMSGSRGSPENHKTQRTDQTW